MIASFRSKTLKQSWIKGDAGGVEPEWRAKVRRVMAVLDQATEPADMDLPSYGFHALTGNMAGRFSLTTSRNWRLAFAWVEGDALDVDLEDYQGG